MNGPGLGRETRRASRMPAITASASSPWSPHRAMSRKNLQAHQDLAKPERHAGFPFLIGSHRSTWRNGGDISSEIMDLAYGAAAPRSTKVRSTTRPHHSNG